MDPADLALCIRLTLKDQIKSNIKDIFREHFEFKFDYLKKKSFALKVVKCDLAANEINIIKMLDHEHILKYCDDFKSKDLNELHCVVTEYCEVKSHTLIN